MVPASEAEAPGDDYLIALAAARGAVLVAGGRHLLGLADVLPVRAPASFLLTKK